MASVPTFVQNVLNLIPTVASNLEINKSD